MILRCLGGRGYSERDPRWSKDDPFLIGADVSLVIIPLFCDWWRLKWCSLSRAFKYILVYRFFILSSGPSDAASEIRQLGRGALYYWPRCSLSRTHAFDELLWKIRERENYRKKTCCWCRQYGCSPTCGPYVSLPVVTFLARGTN